MNITNPFGPHVWMWENNRLISTWFNPNNYGLYLLYYLILMYFKNKNISLIFLLTAISIVLTGSLTSMIGMALFLVYIVMIFLSKKIKIRYIFYFSLCLPFVLIELLKQNYFSWYYLSFDFIVISLLMMFLIVNSKNHQSKFYSSFWVEGVPILWIVILLI